jgi:phosphoribosylamine--glycine ligase
VTPALADRIVQEIMLPVVRELKQRHITYKGILYAGLMIQQESIKVLEFNVRFGDPECQPLMLRLQSDLIEVIEAAIDERLAGVTLSWDPRPAVCVVLAAEGYPGTYETGKPISGLESLRTWKEGVVFHSGTAGVNGNFLTKGGRVLGVTATGATISDAIATAYWVVGQISWPGMHYRHDIGQRALTHAPSESPSDDQ